MDYKCEARGERLVIALSGVMTFDDHDKFRGVVQEIAQSDADKVELSLSDLKMIDSAGIGMVLLANDRSKKSGKSFVISGVTGHVVKVFELSKIDKLIPIV